ncbi:hypothetical protein [Haloferula sp. A504]|uniref:hypothetical protein n=1 Tax=Haloferula sp. A504 TaxID=3373601 RepID=UPI0031C61AB5|nr:hypothetical protein [Verrucomicrobiaceae bacterium E54]
MNTRFFIPVLLAPALSAGEFTVESRPFQVEHRFQATVLPIDPPVLELEPETWSSFVVETLVDHGTGVKKGERIVLFETEAHERRVEDLQRAVKAKEIAVARQQFDLKKLEEEQAIALEAARRAMEIAAEDLKYFREIGRPAAEAEVEQSLVGARFRVESAAEELKQLKQMYEADDLTEDTEEIILKRQQISLEMAEFSLTEAERTAKQTLGTQLPRQLEALQRAASQAALAFSKIEKDQPRALEEAALALKGAEAGLAREKLELERLQKDEALLEWKAPADGVVFHGGLDGDGWDYGDLAKTLKVGGSVPLRTPLLSLVPNDARTRLSAKVEAGIAGDLRSVEPLTLHIPGGGEATASLSSIDEVPGPDGKHAVTLDANWPEELKSEVGTTVECIRVAHHRPDALTVPLKALTPRPAGGWAVELKLADGKTQNRPVKRGPSDGKQVVITEGLEPGQVIVVPE